MLAVVAHLSLVHADRLPAVVAVLREHRVEAVEAVGLAVPHYVPLAAQLLVAFVAGEVVHVPGPALRFCALVGQDDLGEKKG